MTKAETFIKSQLKDNLPEIRPGDTIAVYQKIKERGKERIQAFEGLVLARKHGKGINATITVRKIAAGVGVEKIFPIHSPTIDRIKVLQRSTKNRRAKLYYIHEKAAREVRKKLRAERVEEEKSEEQTPTKESEEKTAEKKEETQDKEAKEKGEDI